MEEAYIFTDDPAFLAELASAVKKLVSRVDAPLLRSILNSYFTTVTRTITNAAPKAIMLNLIRATQEAIYKTLFDAFSTTSTDGLLDEADDVETKRKADVELLEKLRAAKKALEALS